MKHLSGLTGNLEKLIASEDPKSREEPVLHTEAWRQWRRFRAPDAIDALLDACEVDPAEEVRQAGRSAIDTLSCESGISQEAQH